MLTRGHPKPCDWLSTLPSACTPRLRPRAFPGGPMGDEVAATTYTREQRKAYRAKVRRCLDVFERMLVEHAFDFGRPMTGLEIELNLVDSTWQPDMANARVLEAIADPDFQTELGRYNMEFNVPPRPLSG